MQVYKGQTAKEKCMHILDNYENNLTEKCSGLWLDSDLYIAFDNRSRDCWVEEFQTLKEALAYIAN